MPGKIIEVGIIGLLIYTPLAFGGMTELSITVFELVSSGLFIVWLLKMMTPRKRNLRHTGEREIFQHSFFSIIFFITLLVCLLVIFFQAIPIPAPFLKLLSPSTYRLYAEGAVNTGLTLPDWLPLSVCRRATEGELSKFLAYLMVFFLIIDTVQTRQQVKRLVYVILFVGFLEAFYGIIQFISGHHFIYFLKTTAWTHGTFVNKNHFAGYMEMVIALAFGVLFTRLEPGSSSRLKFGANPLREQYPKVFFLLVIVFMLICALLLSGSRGGLISFSIAIIFFALLVNSRRLLKKWIIIFLIFIPVAIGVTVIMNPDIIIPRVSTLLNWEADSSFQVRRELWKTAVHITQDFPLIGSGFGTFGNLNQRYRTFRDDLRHYLYSENDYAQLLAETGIVGLAFASLAGILFFSQIFRAWKQRHSRWTVAMTSGFLCAMFSIAIHSATDFNLHITSNALLFSVIAALCFVTVHLQKAEGRRQEAGGRRQKAEGRRQKAEGRRQKTEGRKTEKQKKRRRTREGQTFSSLVWIIPLLILSLLHLFRVAESYYAFTFYQSVAKDISSNAILAVQSDDVIHSLTRAVQHDRNNAEYYHALGKYSYQRYAEMSQAEISAATLKESFNQAETWLQQAVMLDPANPWYYYELGRLSSLREDCRSGIDSCSTARYFSAVLQNAPNELFLRKAVGLWFYYYDQDTAHRLLREIMAGDNRKISENPGVTKKFSKFLYDIRLDYDSDREFARFNAGNSETCKAHSSLLYASNEAKIEIGNDDGSPEWRTRVFSPSDRVKKVLCLPANLDPYNEAALKIFMNHGGNRNLIVQISVDDHLIKTFEQSVSRSAKWHDIPFDKSLLEGKSKINVYIRVNQASETANFLQIWGDQNPPTTQSFFNFNTTKDLSSAEGLQTGEYMIRLVLKT